MRSVLKNNSSRLDLALRAIDPLLIVAAGFLAYAAYLGSPRPPTHYLTAMAGAALLGFAMFPSLGLYQSRRGTSFVDEVAGLFFAWMTIAVTGGAFVFVTKSGADFSRGWALTWVAGGFAIHVASRAALRASLRALRQHGRNLRHVIVVGAGAHGRGVTARLRAAPWNGLAISAYFDDDPTLIGTDVDGVPVRGPLEGLAAGVQADRIDQVWIALPLRADARIRACVDSLRATPTVIRFVPDIYGFHLLNHSITEIAGMPVLNLTDTPMTDVRFTWKALEDLLLGALLTVVALPLMEVRQTAHDQTESSAAWAVPSRK